MKFDIQRSLSAGWMPGTRGESVAVRRSRRGSRYLLNRRTVIGGCPKDSSSSRRTYCDDKTTVAMTGQYGRGIPSRQPAPASSSTIRLDEPEYVKSLHQVAREGDVETMTTMLERLKPKEVRRRIDELNQHQFAPLHYAARHNHEDMVWLLIRNGADVQIRGRDVLSPLHLVARHVPSSSTDKEEADTKMRIGDATEATTPVSQSPRFLLKQMSTDARPASPTSETSSDVGAVRRYLRRYAISRKQKRNGGPPSTPLHTPTFSANRYTIASTDSPPPSYCSSVDSLDENETVVGLLVSHGAQVNCKDVHGLTPLHYAAMRNNVPVATDLLRCDGINIEARDKENSTPLHLAAVHNSEDMVGLLMDAGANARSRDESYATPLLKAAAEGNLNIVRLILEHATLAQGSSAVTQMLTDQDVNENTTLHLAIENGHLDIVRHLVSKYADIDDKRVDCLNANQETPLHLATEFNHVAIMDDLLDRGADTERQDKGGFTPLLIAARSGHVEAIECLLRHGANPRAIDKDHKTTTYWAVECNRHDALMALLKDSRSRDLLLTSDVRGNSPLHVAAELGLLAITQSLIDLGCHLERKNEDEHTALHLASFNGRAKIVRSLLNSGAASTSEDEDGNTALHLAASMGHVDVVKILLEFGANIETRNGRLWTSLDTAAHSGQVDVVRILLEAGTTMDIQDKTKTTALHWAASSGSVDVVLFLLDSGANVCLRDDQGLNCLELAIENNRRDVVRAIIHSSHWEAAMHSVRYNRDGVRVTPLRTLIRKMPEIAEDVLARCTSTNNVYPEHPLYTVNFDYSLIDDGDDDLAVTKATELIDARRPDTSGANTLPAFLDGHTIKENHPLMIMVRSGQQRLLTHSLCVSLLHLKWIRFGRYFYYANLLFYVLFLALLSTYIITISPPIKPNDPNYYRLVVVDAITNDTKRIVLSACDIWRSNRAMNGTDPDSTFPFINEVGKNVIVVLAVMHMIKELFEVYTMRLHYLGFDNIVCWGCYVSSLMLVIDFTQCSLETGFREVWQWQAGAAAIFLSWINLALLVSKFPYLGIYVVMFTHVCRTFCKVCIIFVFIIVAFAFSFHTVLYYEGSFTNAFKSMIAVAVMMLGEFNFDNLYHDDTLLYPAPAYLIFVLAILIVSIVSMNLLTGLAVHDIKDVKAKANLELMAMQVDLVLKLESMLPSMLRHRFAIRQRSFTPNFGVEGNWLLRMWDRLNNTAELKDALTSVLTHCRSKRSRCLQEHVDQLTDVQRSILMKTTSLSESVEMLRKDYRHLHDMVITVLGQRDIEQPSIDEDGNRDDDDDDDDRCSLNDL